MIHLDKGKKIPLYVQLKNKIIEAVLKGDMKSGMQMPTERDFAKELGVSRKTVAKAYNLLEKQGVVVSHQGKGTFISDEGGEWMQSGNRESVLRLADLMITEAFNKNMEPGELIDFVSGRIQERSDKMKNLIVSFVECNIDQARVFSKDLSELLNIRVEPLTLQDLKNMDEGTREILQMSQMVVPAFNHVQEVKDVLYRHRFSIEVQGVATIPDLKTLIKLAKVPIDSKFCFLALSEEFILKINLAMKKWELDVKNLMTSVSKDEREVWQIVQDHDCIIVSPARFNEISSIAIDGQLVIPFNYKLEEGSVKAIMARLSEKYS